MLISGSSSITSGQGSAGLPTALSFPPDRQDHTEAAPPAGRALDLDPPAVVGDDAVADRQPQARPLADWLGREERLEYPRQDLLRDAAAVVRHLQNHLVAPRRVSISIRPAPRPVASIACMALTRRFRTTWLICAGRRRPEALHPPAARP